MSEELSREELEAAMAELKKENEGLRQAKQAPRPLTCKVSQKGALSVYGLGRFPVSLYRQQWERLLGHGENIQSFIVENAEKLSVKE